VLNFCTFETQTLAYCFLRKCAHRQDSEQKFLEYFSKQAYGSIKVEQYADKPEDGAFKINTLVEMDSHLVKDTHFQEMLQDVDRFCSTTFALVRLRYFLCFALLRIDLTFPNHFVVYYNFVLRHRNQQAWNAPTFY